MRATRLAVAAIVAFGLVGCVATVQTEPEHRGTQATAHLQERIDVAADIGRLLHEKLERAKARFDSGRATEEEVADIEIRAREARMQELALRQELAEGR